MNAKVQIAEVYSKILDKTRLELVVTKGKKTYIGALFFQQDEDEEVCKVVDEENVTGTPEEIIDMYFYLKWRNDMISKDGKTMETMRHWQFMNGFSEEILLN